MNKYNYSCRICGGYFTFQTSAETFMHAKDCKGIDADRVAALEARCKKTEDALRGLMSAHRGVFTKSIFVAFRAGKSNFQKAWLAAEAALNQPETNNERK